MNKASITGVTGQDRAYLTEFLLEKGYEVHGIKRRASSLNTQRIDHIYQNDYEENPKFFLHYGDLTDSSNSTRILNDVQPEEVYNLAALSNLAVSFDSSKPDGAPRKLMNVERLKELGWQYSINLEDGLSQSYQWFLDNQATYRS